MFSTRSSILYFHSHPHRFIPKTSPELWVRRGSLWPSTRILQSSLAPWSLPHHQERLQPVDGCRLGSSSSLPGKLLKFIRWSHSTCAIYSLRSLTVSNGIIGREYKGVFFFSIFTLLRNKSMCQDYWHYFDSEFLTSPSWKFMLFSSSFQLFFL